MSKFKVECANPKCNRGTDGGKAEVFAYAVSKMGTVPPQYCSNFCSAEAKYDKRFISK